MPECLYGFITLQMKARYATRRPYKEWLSTNAVTVKDVVNTAPTAMAPQLLGVPAVSTVHPEGAAAAKKAKGSSNGNGTDPMQEEDAIVSILSPLKTFG
jgi:hypothetical protein